MPTPRRHGPLPAGFCFGGLTLDDPGRRYTLNFDRGPLFGTVGGHHSPLGAYLPDEDLVLVLDVNARYRPWLAHTDRLYEAMSRVDPSTGHGREMLRIE